MIECINNTLHGTDQRSTRRVFDLNNLFPRCYPNVWLRDLTLTKKGMAPWELAMLEDVAGMRLATRLGHRHLLKKITGTHDQLILVFYSLGGHFNYTNCIKLYQHFHLLLVLQPHFQLVKRYDLAGRNTPDAKNNKKTYLGSTPSSFMPGKCNIKNFNFSSPFLTIS